MERREYTSLWSVLAGELDMLYELGFNKTTCIDYLSPGYEDTGGTFQRYDWMHSKSNLKSNPLSVLPKFSARCLYIDDTLFLF